MKLDTPNVSVGKKTNEQNIQTLKGWCTNTANEINIAISQMEARIEQLESIIANLKE